MDESCRQHLPRRREQRGRSSVAPAGPDSPASPSPSPSLSPSPSPFPTRSRPVAALTAAVAAERLSARLGASARASGLRVRGSAPRHPALRLPGRQEGPRAITPRRLRSPPPRSACPCPGRGPAAAAGRGRAAPRGRAVPSPAQPPHRPRRPGNPPTAAHGMCSGIGILPRAWRSGRGSLGVCSCGAAVLPELPGKRELRGQSWDCRAVPHRWHGRGPKLGLCSSGAAGHKAKKAGRFGITKSTKSVPQAQTS